MPYDPAFFPDNSGINFAGGNFCPMSLLLQADRTTLNFDEPGCSNIQQIGLYQSLGASLNGTDLLAISGDFSNDYGHGGSDSTPGWYGNSQLNLFSMIFDGQKFALKGTQSVSTPEDGDWQLSSSATLVSSRIADSNNNQVGYHVHLVDRADGSDTFRLT